MTLPSLVGRGITYTNVAVNGSTIATMTSRYAANVYPYCHAGGALLDINIGRNDIWTSGLTGAATFAALQTYVAQAKADGCKVSVHTIMVNTPVANGAVNAPDAQRIIFNNLMRTAVPTWDYFQDWGCLD